MSGAGRAKASRAAEPGASRRWGLSGATLVGALVLASAAVAIAIGFQAHDPFWLDEAYSAGVVGQPTWADTFRQIYWDVNAPLYYVVLKAWSGVAGLSDAALRAPSLLFAFLTPILAALAPAPGVSPTRRLAWAGMLAGWFPALCYAEEARGYSLLLLVATAQTAAYVRLMAAPDTRRAALWAGSAALAILVHYDAVYLGAAQGLIYLARWRRRAVATWPAALMFLPAFGWLAYHWPRIRLYARPDVAWYSPLTLRDLPRVADYLAGGEMQLQGLGALAVSALSLRLVLPTARERPSSASGTRAWAPAAWAAVAAGVAAALVVGAGMARPSFAYRYLTPEFPGMALGVVLLARLLAGRRAAPLTLAALVLGSYGVSAWMLAHHRRMAPRRYNFEGASTAIARSRPDRLVFVWDHPASRVMRPEQLDALGGVFLRRAGLSTAVTPLVVRPGEDVPARMEATAGNDPRAALLWLYDPAVRGTAAAVEPPDLEAFGPAFACRNYGSGRFGVIGCVRPQPSPPSGEAAHQPPASQPQGRSSP